MRHRLEVPLMLSAQCPSRPIVTANLCVGVCVFLCVGVCVCARARNNDEKKPPLLPCWPQHFFLSLHFFGCLISQLEAIMAFLTWPQRRPCGVVESHTGTAPRAVPPHSLTSGWCYFWSGRDLSVISVLLALCSSHSFCLPL